MTEVHFCLAGHAGFWEGVRSGKVKVPCTFRAVPIDDVPSGWAWSSPSNTPTPLCAGVTPRPGVRLCEDDGRLPSASEISADFVPNGLHLVMTNPFAKGKTSSFWPS